MGATDEQRTERKDGRKAGNYECSIGTTYEQRGCSMGATNKRTAHEGGQGVGKNERIGRGSNKTASGMSSYGRDWILKTDRPSWEPGHADVDVHIERHGITRTW